MEKQITFYTVLLWISVSFYIISSVTNIYGIIFKKEKMERHSYKPAVLGLLIHGFAIIYWWNTVGHGPYMSRNEVLTSDAWIIMFIFLIFSRVYPKIRPASIIVFPSVFLLIALGIVFTPEVRDLLPTLFGIWLVFHIGFYKIAFGTVIIAFAFSLFYVLKKRTRLAWLQKLPEMSVLDLYAYRFAGFGFIFWAIGMLSGSIWAYRAWGRFWGWDPVETASMVTWITFAVYLHLRRFFRLSGESAAYAYFICFATTLATVFFLARLGSSIHEGYFR